MLVDKIMMLGLAHGFACSFHARSACEKTCSLHPYQLIFSKCLTIPIESQLPGGQISPSQIFKKMSQVCWGHFSLVLGILNWLRRKKWGASVASRELQCTLGAEAKKSIALLFGLKSKNVTKWNILFTPTFVPNFKVPFNFDHK